MCIETDAFCPVFLFLFCCCLMRSPGEEVVDLAESVPALLFV